MKIILLVVLAVFALYIGMVAYKTLMYEPDIPRVVEEVVNPNEATLDDTLTNYQTYEGKG